MNCHSSLDVMFTTWTFKGVLNVDRRELLEGDGYYIYILL